LGLIQPQGEGFGPGRSVKKLRIKL
jgi:hypothetical protein